MAKNESTAVNELINLVSTATPRKPDADEDLMFQDPSKRAKSEPPPPPVKPVSVPRMTATVPALRGAGVVEPLPPGRGANGTQKNSALAPQVRVSTAPPSRQVTIPPIGSSPSIPPPPKRALHKTSAALNPKFDLSATSSVGHNLPQSSIGITVPPPAPAKPSLPRPSSSPPVAMPIAAPYAAPLSPNDMTRDQPWFEDSKPADQVTGPVHEETWVGTVQTAKPATTAYWIKKLALPMGAMILLGVAIGGYVAWERQSSHKRDAKPADDIAAPAAAEPAKAEPAAEPVAVAAAEPAKAVPVAVAAAEPAKAETPKTEPAPASVTEPVKAEPAPVTPPNLAVTAPAAAVPAAAAPAVAAKGRPQFVDIRIDSKPEGATVMIVDRGKTNFLGTTPISTSVDPSRQYDLVFTYKDRPTQLEHLDPRLTSKLNVTLNRSGKTEVAAAPAAAPAPKAEKKVVETKVVEKKVVEKKPAPAKVEATETPAPVEAAKPAGEGVLMIASKPPCEIYVDGKATGLTTPQRSLPLPAGKHSVTLVNAAENIKKTISVSITADQSTKVIQDLMQK